MKNIFKRNKKKETVSEPSFPWKPIVSIEQISEIDKESNAKTQLIFKHSSRCIISKMVLEKFEQDYVDKASGADFHFLDLITFRKISQYISSHYQITHESPQLLVINSEKVKSHASHGHINDLILDFI